MKNFHSNHNHTLRHPEAVAEGSGHKSTMSSRFFTAFRMTVSPLSSSDLSLPRLSSLGLTAVVLACLLLTLPTQAKWGDNCTLNGGTIIKANEYGNDKGGKCNDPNNPDLTNNCNGMEFCRSNKEMNWWSAFTWCDSIGGKLASFEHVCPGTQRVELVSCANLKNVHNATLWTAEGYGTKNAILLQKDTVHLDYFGRNTIAHGGWGGTVALCEE